MCSLQLVRNMNKAIGRGFLPLQAKCEAGKTLPNIRKQMDQAADSNILAVKIMHAEGIYSIS